jgi:hypothetical protein
LKRKLTETTPKKKFTNHKCEFAFRAKQKTKLLFKDPLIFATDCLTACVHPACPACPAFSAGRFLRGSCLSRLLYAGKVPAQFAGIGGACTLC